MNNIIWRTLFTSGQRITATDRGLITANIENKLQRNDPDFTLTYQKLIEFIFIDINHGLIHKIAIHTYIYIT